MLWYKSWMDTRFRFQIGLALLTIAACGVVFVRNQYLQLLPMVPSVPASGELGRLIHENAELGRTYRGYIYIQWFSQTPAQLGTLFAVMLGSGSVLSFGLRGGAMFTLSLPVSRDQLVRTRAAMGLGELLLMCLVPSLFICVVSPAIGERYAASDAIMHAIGLFAGTSLFFSLAVLLSTMFDDLWRPLLITLVVSVVIGLGEVVLRDRAEYGVFGVMRGQSYFFTGHLPWLEIAIFAVASAGMLYAASVSIANRDF